MTRPGSSRLVRLASSATLVALGLMVWSLFDPRPLPIIVAMSVAQAIGTASFAVFVVVVLADLKWTRRGQGTDPP